MKVTAARSTFETARQSLETFRHEHMGVFEEYDLLCNQHNESLSDLKKVIKENADKLGKSYGDFKLVATTQIDVDSLIRIIGEDECVEKGYVEKKFSIKRETYELAAKKGNISQDVVDVVEIDGTTQIRGPKPVGIYAR
jgi:hypothetical protein